MPSLTLHCMPRACSRVTMIALEETGAPYDTRVANLAKDEQLSPAYLALNAKGKVPVLVVDGRPLTENVAILSWLADAYPEAELLPSGALERAEALSAVAWLASSTLTTMSRIVRTHRVSDDPAAAEGIRAKAKAAIEADLAIAEAHMAGRTWWADRWSVADAYLFYIVEAMARPGIDTSRYPALRAHAERVRERPAVQRMIAWEQATLASTLAP